MSRFEVYSLRRHSRGTSYAVYDSLASAPVCLEERGAPVSSTSRRAVQELAYALEKTGEDATAEVASALVGCGCPAGKSWRFAHAWRPGGTADA